MKIVFLGTGTSQGVPAIACGCEVCMSKDPKDNRTRSSVLINTNGENLVIDTGPDFRQQVLREEVKSLSAVLYTHEHRDHVAGLDDIRPFNYIQKSPIDVYGEERIKKTLYKEFEYIFAERKYPGIPQVNFHVIKNYPFKVKETEVMPIRVQHYRLPVFGYRIGEFTYITDANYIAEEEKEKMYGTKYLVVNGLRQKKHMSHFSLDEAIDLVNEISPKRAYITHISHHMGLHDEVQKSLPYNVQLAYDGLSIEI